MIHVYTCADGPTMTADVELICEMTFSIACQTKITLQDSISLCVLKVQWLTVPCHSLRLWHNLDIGDWQHQS